MKWLFRRMTTVVEDISLKFGFESKTFCNLKLLRIDKTLNECKRLFLKFLRFNNFLLTKFILTYEK